MPYIIHTTSKYLMPVYNNNNKSCNRSVAVAVTTGSLLDVSADFAINCNAMALFRIHQTSRIHWLMILKGRL